MAAPLLIELRIRVLKHLSFQDLYYVLSLDQGRETWCLPGLRELWEPHMNRYDGPCSVTNNYEAGREITWDWVESRRYKLREMDLFIWAREQRRLGLDHPFVQRYLESGAQETESVSPLEIGWNDVPEYSRYG